MKTTAKKAKKATQATQATQDNVPAPMVMTAPTRNALTSKAVLIRLSAGQFIGNPKDKSLGAELENAHDIAHKRTSVRKKILQGKELSACAAALQTVRNLFAQLSLPWIEGGINIIPSARIVPVKVALEDKIRIFSEKADLFVAAFPFLYLNDQKPAPDGLGTAFNPADYPSVSELRAKFYARVEILPIPTDFRVDGIDTATRDQIAREIEEANAGRVMQAKREILSRVETELRHLAQRLATPADKGKFHGSALTNVGEACESALAVNFDSDPDLAATLESVKSLFSGFSADTIRENETEKARAKDTTEKALAAISGAMAGFMQ